VLGVRGSWWQGTVWVRCMRCGVVWCGVTAFSIDPYLRWHPLPQISRDGDGDMDRDMDRYRTLEYEINN
jgi:hypothetical protein